MPLRSVARVSTVVACRFLALDLSFRPSQTQRTTPCSLQYSVCRKRTLIVPRRWPASPFSPDLAKMNSPFSLDGRSRAGLRRGKRFSRKASPALASMWSSQAMSGFSRVPPAEENMCSALKAPAHPSPSFRFLTAAITRPLPRNDLFDRTTSQANVFSLTWGE